MKAVAVHPGTPGSMHLREIPEPAVERHPGRARREGAGPARRRRRHRQARSTPPSTAPRRPGDDFLVTGPRELRPGGRGRAGRPLDDPPGDVRRRVGAPARHVDLREDRPPGLHHRRRLLRARDQPPARLPDRVLRRGPPVRVPAARRAWPRSASCSSRSSVAEKGVNHAYEIQRRLRVWQPRRACVLGSGTLGLLTALVARLRGLELTVFSLPREAEPQRRPDRAARRRLRLLAGRVARGRQRRARAVRSDLRRDRLQPDRLGGGRGARRRTACSCSPRSPAGARKAEVNSDAINQGFVLGNKVMVGTVNASPDDFRSGVDDLVKAEAHLSRAGCAQLLTTPIDGLENYEADAPRAHRRPRRDPTGRPKPPGSSKSSS